MDPGFRSALIDFFLRGEAGRDVRLTAAQGSMAPRAHEQVALLIMLVDDPDAEVAAQARATIEALPVDPLRAFLARSDASQEMRDFFAARGVEPGPEPAADADRPLLDADPDADPEPEPAETETEEEKESKRVALSSLSVMQRMKLAMKGTREQRAQLIRDSNKLVSAAVLSSPKLTEVEVEAFVKMGNVSEETLRTISMNRSWMKNYGVILGLTKHPKTPPAISMRLLARLNERDQKALTTDRNVPEGLRLAARKYLVKGMK